MRILRESLLSMSLGVCVCERMRQTLLSVHLRLMTDVVEAMAELVKL